MPRNLLPQATSLGRFRIFQEWGYCQLRPRPVPSQEETDSDRVSICAPYIDPLIQEDLNDEAEGEEPKRPEPFIYSVSRVYQLTFDILVGCLSSATGSKFQ